ncbi:MAG: hydrogenase iron-sulfur subunit [Desulfobacterales bacterium]|jgi:F420-non-reducing hydrogenase iron-sulfur subunit|nr:hydrogenase iron-sulfur subunit [Desulfobacteraceae bacterium]MBT7086207.1 hydrogenase iron-sulfur subunit [Desulfobacterales bacterium]
MEKFEPVIVAFCCNYCAYTAADMAGSKRLCYPPNIKIIRVPCSGKVDAIHIIKALEKGADGVLVAGCLEGDCHFKNGNIEASKKVTYIKNLLDEIGIGGERVEMVLMSAGMGERFAQTAIDITKKIRVLGPNPAKSFTPDKASNDL